MQRELRENFSNKQKMNSAVKDEYRVQLRYFQIWPLKRNTFRPISCKASNVPFRQIF